ncbi:class I SAM-dependent methyltransferase [Actinoplanes sp. NPDC023801]|uniref:class I SAM-dependent methyltransferase n=1 Tax=Actinoplanes sp. NPDC023801 TaxID=3154595 RepID=UPI0033F8D6B6
MSSTVTDATAVRAEQRAVWDAVAPGWLRWQPAFERGAAVVTEMLLDLGGVRPGHAVLDLGSGAGEPASGAARRVGPHGRVVGVDLSEQMTVIARRRVPDEYVTFHTGDLADVELPAGSFDVCLSRWGLMFLPDRRSALARLAGLLRPGGTLAAAVWGPPPEVPMISLAFRVIAAELALPAPPPGGPGPFAVTDPEVLRADVAAGGFRDVSVHDCTVPFRLDSPAQFAAYSRDVLPPRMRQAVRDRCGTLDDPRLWAAVERAAEPYMQDDGTVLLPSRAICVRAETDRP